MKYTAQGLLKVGQTLLFRRLDCHLLSWTFCICYFLSPEELSHVKVTVFCLGRPHAKVSKLTREYVTLGNSVTFHRNRMHALDRRSPVNVCASSIGLNHDCQFFRSINHVKEFALLRHSFCMGGGYAVQIAASFQGFHISTESFLVNKNEVVAEVIIEITVPQSCVRSILLTKKALVIDGTIMGIDGVLYFFQGNQLCSATVLVGLLFLVVLVGDFSIDIIGISNRMVLWNSRRFFNCFLSWHGVVVHQCAVCVVVAAVVVVVGMKKSRSKDNMCRKERAHQARLKETVLNLAMISVKLSLGAQNNPNPNIRYPTRRPYHSIWCIVFGLR